MACPLIQHGRRGHNQVTIQTVKSVNIYMQPLGVRLKRWTIWLKKRCGTMIFLRRLSFISKATIVPSLLKLMTCSILCSTFLENVILSVHELHLFL